ncbi:MAG TPA: hypothetical protein VIM58_11725 [Candidatus Methylacidiphilales bacterium]
MGLAVLLGLLPLPAQETPPAAVPPPDPVLKGSAEEDAGDGPAFPVAPAAPAVPPAPPQAPAPVSVPDAPAAAPAVPVDAYMGFRVDDSLVAQTPRAELLRAALREQIAMVLAVGLPDEVTAFFRRVPIRVVPPSGQFQFTPGYYEGRSKEVQMSTSFPLVGHKPVLLHELFHAYHAQKIPGGTANPAILGFYREGKASGRYASASHMLDNEREFFACSVTTYLFGVTAQEPFQREKLQAAQPEWVAYLRKLCGPGAGSYAGSLTAPGGTVAGVAGASPAHN